MLSHSPLDFMTIRIGIILKNIKKQRYAAVIMQKITKFAFKLYL